MPTLTFTRHLLHLLPSGPLSVPGDTPRAALEQVLRDYPLLRSYLLDEHGGLRKHVALFIDGELRRDGMDQPVAATTKIDFMQALSGG